MKTYFLKTLIFLSLCLLPSYKVTAFCATACCVVKNSTYNQSKCSDTSHKNSCKQHSTWCDIANKISYTVKGTIAYDTQTYTSPYNACVKAFNSSANSITHSEPSNSTPTGGTSDEHTNPGIRRGGACK
jgi:hypothetical protein